MSRPEAILPIFRSQAQARILAWLLLVPAREQPIATLAAIAGIAQPNTLREVNRLVECGILRERRAGNTRLVSANLESPYYEPLVQILGRAYGPADAVPKALSSVPDIERAVIVGSWAQRFHGEPGPAPEGVEVIVVGSPPPRRLRAANADLEECLGVPVRLTVVASMEWDAPTTGYLRAMRSGPCLTVMPPAGSTERQATHAAPSRGEPPMGRASASPELISG
ncbi:hypothetical protein ACFV9C_42655 [Kribbella sp. NPDC059898]|uniref:hypothetical protein n=1 Tax=Kribbella sp. NPDC059898 TaxID=3346995 RepID=UPI00364EB6CD